ncbi:MAG: J domain-containing protein [Planctomycetes bacterium]|nr:J domain-containing protein [Planctomycetota bacterium]
MAKRDYYQVLGVSRGASEDDIKKAFRKLAKQLQPDQNSGDQNAETKFKEAQEAYAVLSDRQRRSQYDQFGHAEPMGGGFHPGGGGTRRTWSSGPGQSINIEDLADMFDFDSIFGGRSRGRTEGSPFESMGGGAQRRGRGAEPARDIEFPVSLTFDRAIRGTSIELDQPSTDGVRQRIKVTIPPGVRDGQKVRVRGKGAPGRGRKAAGDLYVVVHIQEHPYFVRKDDDLYVTVPVTVAEATLGAKVDVPTLDGKITVTIPPGTTSGAKLRLAGMGVPHPSREARGDLFFEVKIVPPKKPTDEQRAAMEAFAKLDTSSPRNGLW